MERVYVAVCFAATCLSIEGALRAQRRLRAVAAAVALDDDKFAAEVAKEVVEDEEAGERGEDSAAPGGVLRHAEQHVRCRRRQPDVEAGEKLDAGGVQSVHSKGWDKQQTAQEKTHEDRDPHEAHNLSDLTKDRDWHYTVN